MNILVTGGAGFIGSHTCDALIEAGHRVRILDSLEKTVHPNGKPGYLNPDADRAGWEKPETWAKYAAFVATTDPAVFTGKILTQKELAPL